MTFFHHGSAPSAKGRALAWLAFALASSPVAALADGAPVELPSPPPGFVPPSIVYVPVPVAPPPEVIEWDGQSAPPYGYEPATRSSKGLVIGGAVTFGTLYLTSCVLGATVRDGNGGGDFLPLFIPIAGPWITIGTSRAPAEGAIPLLVDGLLQAGSAGMFIAGFAFPDHVLVRTTDVRLSAAPFATDRGGLALRGIF